MAGPSDFFRCKMCGECCKGYGGTFVSQREISRISKYLDIDPEAFVRDYCTLSGKRPLIKSGESGYCVFWEESCTIHEVKPRMCKAWPFIESMIADPTNWVAVKSVCPGVLKEIDEDTLAQCVERVRLEYEREWEEIDSPEIGEYPKTPHRGKLP